MTTELFGQIVTAMVTPFTADGKLDLAGARGLAGELTRPGRGSGGEGPPVRGRARVTAGCGAAGRCP